MSELAPPDGLVRAAVVVDDLRLLYVPVTRAASTSLLWAAAEWAGLTEEHFARSKKLEVSRPLMVHDMAIWGDRHRLDARSLEEQERILFSGEWFRLTVVREPLRRLWSAWVMKLLVHDPRFSRMFGSEDWFPRPPDSAQDVVESFRRFVHVLPTQTGGRQDPHWASQADFIAVDHVPFDHIGRVERLDATMEVLERVASAAGRRGARLRHENPTLLRYSPGLFDRPTLDVCLRFTERDRTAFGYPTPSSAAEPDEAWYAATEAAIPAIRALIERNERIGDLWSQLSRQRSLPERLRGSRRS